MVDRLTLALSAKANEFSEAVKNASSKDIFIITPNIFESEKTYRIAHPNSSKAVRLAKFLGLSKSSTVQTLFL